MMILPSERYLVILQTDRANQSAVSPVSLVHINLKVAHVTL
jgi:hypothetical protein